MPPRMSKNRLFGTENEKYVLEKAPDELREFNFFWTITLNPDLNNLQLREQYHKTVPHVDKLIRSYFKDYRYSVEITPKNGHLHFHGISHGLIPITFDIDTFRLIFLDKIRGIKSLGFSMIESINSIDKSYSYIKKDVVKTFNVLNHDKSKKQLPVYFKPEVVLNKTKTICDMIRMGKKSDNKADNNTRNCKENSLNKNRDFLLKHEIIKLKEMDEEINEINKLLKEVEEIVLNNPYFVVQRRNMDA